MSNIIGNLYLTKDEYDWYGEEVGWNTLIIYKDETGGFEPFNYFYSPDGVGRIWLNTLDEMYKIFDETAKIVIVKRKEN